MTNPQAEMRQQLMNALYQDNFTTIKELLEKGVNINLPYNHNGWTPFMWVCKEHCDPDVIKMFLNYGAKLDKVNSEGQTALHIMARKRSSFECLELLIEAGADVNAQDKDGWTPLMDVVHHPQAMMRKNVIHHLAEYSDTSIKNKDGKTAHDIAKENEAFDDEDLLLLLKPVDDLTPDEFVNVFNQIFDGDSNV